MKNPLLCLLLVPVLAACASQDARDERPEASPPARSAEALRSAMSAPPEPIEEAEVEPSIYLGSDRVVNMPEAPPPVRIDGEAVSLNFEQAPVTEVVHSILGDTLELDYVVEHPLKGALTLRTRTPVPRDQLLPILESLLQANGATLVRDPNGRYFIGPAGSLDKLMPSFDSPDSDGAGFRHIIVPLSYISAPGMAEILAPVAPESAFVRVDAARNLLVLAGTRNQLDGWLNIVSTFDVDQLKGMSVGIFPIRHSTVEDVQAAVAHLLGGGAGGEGVAGGDLSRVVRVMPLENLNSILVVTPRSHYIQTVREWIDRLDRPQEGTGEASLHVYSVQNGSATHLADMLSRIFGGSGGGRGGKSTGSKDSGVAPGLDAMSMGSGSSGGSGGDFQAPDTGNAGGSSSYELGDNVRIVADEYNNALLVHAPYREFAKIESALRQLDVIANQVLIEASIIEVTLADELEFGVEWFLEDGLGGGRTGTASLDLDDAAGIGPRVPGFSYSIANGSGVLRGVINTLARRSLVNVISTPSVMVLDNHTAAIHVGDQQPVQSSISVTDGGRQTSSIEYRDTGVKLQVTPSVNAGGLVTMDISQSVTDVGQVDTATDQRTFLERNVSSRVAVRSGESVVLGGLIRDNKSKGKLGVPFLHEIPVIGHLFGRTSNENNRTELLVFITPRVLRNEQELRDVSTEMRARMKGLKHFDDLPLEYRTDPEADKTGQGGDAQE